MKTKVFMDIFKNTVLGLTLVLIGCGNFLFDPIVQADNPKGEGNLEIIFQNSSSAAKTIFPSLAFTRHVLSFTPVTEGLMPRADIEVTGTAQSVMVDLPLGTWTIRVTGYDSSGPIAWGESNVQLFSSSVSRATINRTTPAAGTGTREGPARSEPYGLVQGSAPPATGQGPRRSPGKGT